MLTIITVTLAVGLSVGAIITVLFAALVILIIVVVSPVLKVYQQPLFKTTVVSEVPK